jgi:heme-degrading monooxygenase HmoA
MEILPRADDVTIINVFETTPEVQQELVEHIGSGTKARTLTKPGFLGMALHASTDGRRVVIYSRWQTVEAWRAYLDDPDVKAGAEISRSIAPSDPHVYVVDSVYEPVG